MNLLPHIKIDPKTEARASVIWLHGLGANGHDFESIVPELKRCSKLGIRFIFPHAPSRAVTLNNGMVMPSWYDITSLNVARDSINKAQLNDSADSVRQLIDHQIEQGIASERIVLAGFSQGGAVILVSGLTYPKPLAGLLALSTYFPSSGNVQCSDCNKKIAIQIMHGQYDPVVLPLLADKMNADLKALGYKPDCKYYPMEHSLCAEQIQDIDQWLYAQLGSNS